jgi:hypothetical protein
MQAEDRRTFERKALEALQESTKILEVAEQLLSVGNLKEAERLRDKAREQRNVSVWLMSQARGTDANPKEPRKIIRGH